MKIKNNYQNENNNRLLISELISFKTYKTEIKIKLQDCPFQEKTRLFFLKQTSFFLKRILQIIFEYHYNRKKILIVGEKSLAKKQFFLLEKKTDHTFISETAWVNGLLSNNKTIQKFLKKKNPILEKIKNPRLVVSYNYWDLINSESYNRRMTSITLTGNSLKSKYRYSENPAYYSSGNLTEIRKKKIQFFMTTLIEKILKLPKINPKRFKVFFLYEKKSKKNYYRKKHKPMKMIKNKKYGLPSKFFKQKPYYKLKDAYKTKI